MGRMSQYEQRRLGNAGRGVAGRLPEGGNALLRAKGLSVGGGHRSEHGPDGDPGCCVSSCSDVELMVKPSFPRGVCGRALESRDRWEGLSGICRRCQPDSGNPTVRDERGACGNVTDSDFTKGARAAFLPDNDLLRDFPLSAPKIGKSLWAPS